LLNFKAFAGINQIKFEKRVKKRNKKKKGIQPRLGLNLSRVLYPLVSSWRLLAR